MIPSKKGLKKLHIFHKKINHDIKNKFYSKANCFKAILSNVKFYNVNFKGATLTKCNFKNSSFSSVDFLGTNVRGSNFSNATFNNCLFVNVLLKKANRLVASLKNNQLAI